MTNEQYVALRSVEQNLYRESVRLTALNLSLAARTVRAVRDELTAELDGYEEKKELPPLQETLDAYHGQDRF